MNHIATHEPIYPPWYVYTLVYNGEAYFADQIFHLTDDQKTLADNYAQNLSLFLGDGMFQQYSGGYGCGPTSMAIVVSSLTGDIVDPVKMAKWAYENGGRCKGEGSYHSFIPNAAKAWNLSIILNEAGHRAGAGGPFWLIG